MRLGRILTGEGPRFVALEGDVAVILEGSLATGLRRTDVTRPWTMADLLCPLEPSKVVAVATNYPLHALEMGKPLPDEARIFVKPSTSVVGPGDAIRIPPGTTRVDPECELGIVIGKLACRVPVDRALDYVLGYTAVNDVTARDYQKKDVIFGRAKGYDTFCPIGPWVDTELDGHDLAIETLVNGEVRARGRTSEMHFGIEHLVAYISAIMTLLPGDVIATGTPPGVAPIVAGDRVVIRLEGLGDLTNPVVDREDR